MTTKVVHFLIGILLLASCGHRQGSDASDRGDSVEVSDITEDGREWADSVASALTLRQKVSQLFMPAVFSADDKWTLSRVREYGDSCIGGLILLKGTVKGAESVIEAYRESAPVGGFVAIDAEWGLAMRLEGAPRFPENSSLGAGVDDQTMYDYGSEVARECRILGINMVLGPVVDVSAPGSFMRKRSFGSDARRVASLATAYARGLEDGGVISVAKHFPGHGSVTADSHLRKGVIERSLNELDSIDLYPYRKWIEQGLMGIMVGHLAVPSIDPEMLPAAVSPIVITELLRTDLGFKGLIITDALNMKGAEGYGALDAIIAGADMVIAPQDTQKEIETIMTAVDEGLIEEELIDRKVKNILFYKYLFGLNHSPAPGRTQPSTPADLNLSTPRADSLSRRLAS